MGFTKAFLVVAVAYVMSSVTAWAGDLCPEGPFETDIHAIAAAIAAEPLRPLTWYAATAVSGMPENERITDGAFSAGGGGLGNSGDRSTSYDAKRYVVVSVARQWPSTFTLGAGRSESRKPIPHQVIQKVGDMTYTTIVARPAPEDAREFACLANRLLVPKRESPPSPPSAIYEPPSDPRVPAEVTVIAPRRSSESCQQWFSDAHWESFSLVTSRQGLAYDNELSCAARDELERHIEEVIFAPVNDVMEQGAGSWQPPRVHSVAVDAADNLYLLIDSGTHRRRSIDVREVMPTGEVKRMYANVSQKFFGNAFTVAKGGQAWVPVPERNGTVIHALSSAFGQDVAALDKPFGAFYPQKSRASFQAITADANDNLYAMDESEVFKITPTGAVTLLADWGASHPADLVPFATRFQLVVANDETLFVSDSSYDVILKVGSNGDVAIVAGALNEPGAADGRADTARLRQPKGLALDRVGNLYVADSGNHTIRRISSDGQVSTIAGKQGRRGTVDGRGTSARFDSPASIAMDSSGMLYVTNGVDNLIRKISPTGVVSTVSAQQFLDVQ